MQCEKCKAETTPKGGGLPLPREYAFALMKMGVEVMCFEYGSDCDECEGECLCWTGVSKDDLDEDGKMDEDYKTFELWI